jgi:hypothetical protein
MVREKNMNKKGFGFPSIITIFILIFVVMILAMAQKGIDSSTIDKTIETLNWSRLGQNVTNAIEVVHQNNPNEIVRVIFGIVGKGIDFMGYSIMEVSKLAMKLAKDNPDIINWKVLLWIIIISLLAPIIYYVFLGGIVIFLLIREWVLNKRERKKLANLERQRR